MFKRAYIQHDNHSGTVTLDDIQMRVVHHDFWYKFAQGWEPDTERIYREYVQSGATVLDIGAWIGSTIIFALACGAQKIIAFEPNPDSFAVLQRLIERNPQYAARVTLVNQAVGASVGRLSMGLAYGENDTSTSGIVGDDFTVETTTIPLIRSQYNLSEIDLIKIDIEGAELYLADALAELGGAAVGSAGHNGQVVHLSVHVPFFPQHGDSEGDVKKFIAAMAGFAIADDRGAFLSQDEFAARILSTQKHPPWGTQHGNFFEVVLVGNSAVGSEENN